MEIKVKAGKEFECYNKRLCERLAALLREEADRNRCIIASFDTQCLAWMNRFLPCWKRALIAYEIGGDDTTAKRMDALFVFKKNIGKALLETARRKKQWVCAWTVDDAPTMQALAKRGVNAIASNNAALLQNILDARRRRL
jgi:glycerophosphoryl diester phosphodiesterase